MRFMQVMNGVFHLEDNMGVCMTLLTGRNRALLIDTGYGLDSLPETVREITNLPLTVVLTHGHHDHVLGATQFPKTQMCREDLEEFRLRTSRIQRERVAEQARGKGLTVPEDFFVRPVPEPEALPMNEVWAGFPAQTEDLGDLKVRLIKVPGHTSGSICLYVEELQLLLTGDDWNPCTWLWFPASTGVMTWRRNMNELFEKTPFSRVLCSHRSELFDRVKASAFLKTMTDETLLHAGSNPLGRDSGIDTRQVLTEDGQILVFDYQKYLEEIGK